METKEPLFVGDPIRILSDGSLVVDGSGIVAAINLDGTCAWWKKFYKGKVIDESRS